MSPFLQQLKRRFNLSALIGGVLIVVVGMMVAGAIQAIQDNFREQIRLDSTAQEVALLELEVETKKFENQYFNTSEYIDLQARKLLNKAAPGEKLIILPPTGFEGQRAEANLPSASTKAEPPLKDRSNVEQWLYFLFGNKR